MDSKRIQYYLYFERTESHLTSRPIRVWCSKTDLKSMPSETQSRGTNSQTRVYV